MLSLHLSTPIANDRVTRHRPSAFETGLDAIHAEIRRLPAVRTSESKRFREMPHKSVPHGGTATSCWSRAAAGSVGCRRARGTRLRLALVTQNNSHVAKRTRVCGTSVEILQLPSCSNLTPRLEDLCPLSTENRSRRNLGRYTQSRTAFVYMKSLLYRFCQSSYHRLLILFPSVESRKRNIRTLCCGLPKPLSTVA